MSDERRLHAVFNGEQVQHLWIRGTLKHTACGRNLDNPDPDWTLWEPDTPGHGTCLECVRAIAEDRRADVFAAIDESERAAWNGLVGAAAAFALEPDNAELEAALFQWVNDWQDYRNWEP